MNQWEEMQRLYHAALALPPPDRAAWLGRECAGDEPLREEVAALLAHETTEGPFDRPAVEAAARSLRPDALRPEALKLHDLTLDEVGMEAGTMIGSYRILAPLGRGGMGMVYRAEQQQPVRRPVALKVIKPGMDSQSVMSRFQAERQTLALMDHPHIARVFDAGTTGSGRLYFVMELVDGLPVTEYCTRANLNLRDRVALFIPICQAIQHAHQKGIIHRDIKPSNVLVSSFDGRPVPKVIDFGIAKAVAPDGLAPDALAPETAHTQLGIVIGTPDYMSPEQAGQLGVETDIDTRSDIYSLGALLYELVTGGPPLKLAKLDSLELLRRIREEDPPPPSLRLGDAKLAREIRGDLDWVVMRALEKDRARRYASASALAADLERYLQGDPVSAGPPSTTYRLRKLARRYRAWLAVAAAFLAVLLLAVVFSVREAVKARRAERSAVAISEFLQQDLLAQASANVQVFAGGRPDPDLKVRTALDRASARVATKFAAEPILEAALRHTLASAYLDLGLYAEALRHTLRAVAVRRQQLGERDAATLSTEALLANVYLDLGKPKEAAPIAQRLFEVRRQSLGERHPDTITALSLTAAIERAFKHNEKAIAILTRVTELRREVLGPAHGDTQQAEMNLGLSFMYQDKFKEAAGILQRLLDQRERSLGQDHPLTVDSRYSLSLALKNIGEAPRAERLMQDVLSWRRRVLGPTHRETLTALNGLAMVTEEQGKYPEAGKLYTECIALAGPTLGERHPTTEGCRRNRANTLTYMGRHEEAMREYQGIVQRDIQVAGAQSPDTLRDSSNLGMILARTGRYAEGREMLVRVIDERRRVLGPKDAKTLSSMNSLALIEQRRGRFAEARALFEQVAPLRREVLGPTNSRTLETLTSLAYVMLEQGQAKAAEALLRETMPVPPEQPWTGALGKNLLGWSLASQRRLTEAEPLLREGAKELSALQRDRPAEDHVEVERAQRRLRLLAQ